MGRQRFTAGLAAYFAAGVLCVSGAAAHHGWSWAEGNQTELSGTVRQVYIGEPHPNLQIEIAGSGLWIVELAPPRQTAKSGFSEASVKPGDQVVAIGNRSLNPTELRMKAVQLRVGDRTYDIYPDRIR
jgi:hypothetical protein